MIELHDYAPFSVDRGPGWSWEVRANFKYGSVIIQAFWFKTTAESVAKRLNEFWQGWGRRRVEELAYDRLAVDVKVPPSKGKSHE